MFSDLNFTNTVMSSIVVLYFFFLKKANVDLDNLVCNHFIFDDMYIGHILIQHMTITGYGASSGIP
jgi:hypothetical protein